MKSVLVVVVLLVIGGVFVAIMPPSRPAVHENLDAVRMRAMIEMLYYRGFDGGMLFLEVQGEPHFLQLRKQIHTRDGVSLRCDFPLVAWSKDYYPRVRTYLESAGISYTDSTSRTDLAVHGDMPERTLVISLGSDIGVAEAFVNHIFVQVFGIDPATQVVATVEHVSPLNQKIGFDDP